MLGGFSPPVQGLTMHARNECCRAQPRCLPPSNHARLQALPAANGYLEAVTSDLYLTGKWWLHPPRRQRAAPIHQYTTAASFSPSMPTSASNSDSCTRDPQLSDFAQLQQACAETKAHTQISPHALLSCSMASAFRLLVGERLIMHSACS